MSRVLAAAMLLAALAFPAAAQAPSPRAAPADVAKRIAAVKAKVGSDYWDLQVELILLADYDFNKSEVIDTEEELAAIPCEVWQAIDSRLRTRGGKGVNLIKHYGFGPNGDFLGVALGIGEKLRKSSYARLGACGLKDR